MNKFEDVLEKRRKQNDLLWVTKFFRPKQGFYQNSNDINPLTFCYKVLTDNNIHLLMREAFPKDSQSNLFKRLDLMLTEIGYSKNISVVRWLGFVLIKILKKVMHSIFITEAKLLRLKSNMGKHPVILLPTHRSYADFILMAFLCFNYDIEIPVVVAGMDFHAMFGVGTLLRQCGAMYMRRSFKDDKIYGTVFKKYVQTVIANGNSPFEFFIEGTRSRCGKSLMPKLGLLKMVVEVFQTNAVNDITFVPVSINYDRLLEDFLFAQEVVGIPKPKESTTGLLKAVSLLKERYGNIYINIGTEISLSEFRKECNNENDLIQRLAQMIVKRQQENTVLTFFNMLSIVVISRLVLGNRRNMEITSIIEDVVKLKNILICFGALINPVDDVFEEIKRSSSIHKFLSLDNNGNISIPDIFDSDTFNKNIFKIAVTIITLQHYANPCYHFLINPAIIVCLLRIHNTSNESILFSKFKYFRMLFKHEFVLFEPTEHQDFMKACACLCDLNLLKMSSDKQLTLLDKKSVDNFWWCMLSPYLNGYLFICESLIQMAHKTMDVSRLKLIIRKQLELQLDVSDDVTLYYALSSYFTSCTISSLTDINILHSNGTNHVISIMDLEKLKAVIYFLRSLLNKGDIMSPQLVDFTACKL